MNAVVDLQTLRNTQLATQPAQNVTMGFGSAQGFELMQRAAKAFAASTLVPQQFQGNVPNCMIALEMSARIGASPLLVAQNLYIVHGRPGWSAKFLIATFNQCGRFSAIRYEWKGEKGKKDWACRAWATEKESGERIQSAWITWELVEAEQWNKKSGSKWLTMPEQMFMYRSAAWLVNTHAPEISMGLNTADELTDTFDATRNDAGTYTVETLRSEHTHGDASQGDDAPPPVDAEVLPPEDSGNTTTSEVAQKYPDIITELDQMQDMASFARYIGGLPAKLKKELEPELVATQKRIQETACAAPGASA